MKHQRECNIIICAINDYFTKKEFGMSTECLILAYGTVDRQCLRFDLNHWIVFVFIPSFVCIRPPLDIYWCAESFDIIHCYWCCCAAMLPHFQWCRWRVKYSHFCTWPKSLRVAHRMKIPRRTHRNTYIYETHAFPFQRWIRKMYAHTLNIPIRSVLTSCRYMWCCGRANTITVRHVCAVCRCHRRYDCNTHFLHSNRESKT